MLNIECKRQQRIMINTPFGMLNRMSITDRINERLRKTGKKATQLADAVGRTRGAVSGWTGGGAVNLRPDNLVNAADFLECEVRWLAVGKGPESRQRTDAQDELLRITATMERKDCETLLEVARAMAARASSQNLLPAPNISHFN